jgi:pyridoxal 5'-phosphate synthase pdxT subunit
MAKIGVLALQGAFREHAEVLDALGVEAVHLRSPDQLAGLDAVILPGGESTTIGRLLETSGLLDPLRDALESGLPALGTCAGLILVARNVLGGRPGQASLGVVDIVARRNAYGRQRESFEVALEVEELAGGPFPGVFIRAPGIESVGPEVTVLATHENRAVLARQNQVWAASFHPELSGDLRLHQRFVDEVI